MTVINFLKRRCCGKITPILKKILFPVLAMVLLYSVVSKSPAADKTPNYIRKMPDVIPGEALDPLAPKIDLEELPAKLKERKKKEKAEEENANIIESEIEKKKDGYHEQDVKPISSSWSMYKMNIKDHEKVKAKGHAITEKTVTLTLMSSSDKVFMSINKREIYRGLEDRGLHVVVINQYTGRVMAKEVFDTSIEGHEYEMVDFIEDISNGRIIVIAVRDDAAKNLSWYGRVKLKDLGSRWASKLSYRDMWALVTRQGGLKLAETYSNVATADTGYEWGGPVFLRTDFDLETGPSECSWPSSPKNEERQKFCARYEGYSGLCDCKVKHWDDVFFQLDLEGDKDDKVLRDSRLRKNMAIPILSTNRPLYLYKTLKSLWQASGINKENIFVYCESPKRELINLVKLFGVKLIETHTFANLSIHQNIRHKVQRIISDLITSKFDASSVSKDNIPHDTKSKNFDNIFFLQDDVKVSVDILKYLESIYPTLKMDKTILGITAFNYFGDKEVASSLTSFYRTSDANDIALLLPRDVIVEKLVPKWPAVDETISWKSMLQVMISDHKDSAFIYPEVPRAHHFSFKGYLVSGGIQWNIFKDHIISLSNKYTVTHNHLKSLTLPTYDDDLRSFIKKTEPMMIDFSTQELTYGHDPKLVFVQGDADDKSWSYVMRKMHTWSVFSIFGWKGTWRFTYHGHPLTIVLTPNSTLSDLHTPKHKIITASEKPPVKSLEKTENESKKKN